MAAQDPQSRRWSLTINNPKDCGLDHDTIIERLHLFHPRYFCLAAEIGESGTYHTHFPFSDSIQYHKEPLSTCSHRKEHERLRGK